jgi:hypothetical protein
MYKKYFLFSIILITILTANKAEAQSDSIKNHLMFVPHYLGFNGIRIDYERKISSNHWIQLSPELYFKEKSADSDYEEDSPFFETSSTLRKLVGVGVNAYHKIYLGISYRKPGAYISYGASAGYFEIEYANDYGSGTTSFNAFPKIGGDVIIGYDIGFNKNLIMIGFYTGLGFRYSFTDDDQIKKNFTRNMYDYAYSGNIFLIGIRIGTKF